MDFSPEPSHKNSLVMVEGTEACYDVVVLGAGIQGSSTAYYLKQKAGVEKVLLLEQVFIVVFRFVFYL